MRFCSKWLELASRTRQFSLTCTQIFPDPKQPFSRSRHANSTLDVHDDFNVELRAITLRDGNVNKAFPKNLRELFSYDCEHYRPPADPEYKMY